MNFIMRISLFGVILMLLCLQAITKARSPFFRTFREDSVFMDKRVIVVPVANLRSSPSDISDGIIGPALSKEVGCQETQLLFGEYLYAREVSEAPDWLYVRSCTQVVYDKKGWHGYEGYLKRSDTGKVYEFVEHNLVVSALSASLFSDRNMEILKTPISLGTMLCGSLVSPDVYMVALPLEGGAVHKGFIAASNVREYRQAYSLRSKSKMIREEIIALGRRCLGIPYIWGGRSLVGGENKGDYLLGADCSSFVELLYKVYGVVVPRNAHDQYLKAVPVQKGSQVQKGDLLFITSRKNPARMSHVVFYAGDGIILHLSGDGYSSVSEALNPWRLVVREDADFELLGNSIASFNNGDTLTYGEYAGSKVFFGSFLP